MFHCSTLCALDWRNQIGIIFQIHFTFLKYPCHINKKTHAAPRDAEKLSCHINPEIGTDCTQNFDDMCSIIISRSAGGCDEWDTRVAIQLQNSSADCYPNVPPKMSVIELPIVT